MVDQKPMRTSLAAELIIVVVMSVSCTTETVVVVH
jgi:hypothetical protein